MMHYKMDILWLSSEGKRKRENMIWRDCVLCYIENVGMHQQRGGGPFDFGGGYFVVLEIFRENNGYFGFFLNILKNY